jgi:glycogen debranching enzyme
MALNWVEECGDKDKDLFLEYQRKNEKGLFHQGWKDGFEDHLKIEPPVAMVEV